MPMGMFRLDQDNVDNGCCFRRAYAANCGIRFPMLARRRFPAAVFVAASLAVALGRAQPIAPTPPMGWNSWDAYGLTIDQAQFESNATVLAGLRQYGWQYVVIDEGWYMEDPFGQTVADKKYLWNANGLLIPAPDRFPSAADGAGFKPLADWVHAHGLKFGIHIVRGIPRQVVAANLPIAGTHFRARDAADIASPCPWDEGNWGVKDNAAGQAYYDSMIRLYAAWGVDFLKVDCIANNPYRPTEIRQIAAAIRKTGRPIVLSLSPGPTALDHAAEVAKYAQMWRISNDHWDVWSPEHKPGQGEFPFGLRSDFDRLAEWAPYAGPGHWPDADMLPWGWLGPHPGWGQPRQSRETRDEQRTEFTLWSMARSPLILGANLTRLDPFTRSLLTNREVIDIDQHSIAGGPARVPMNDGYPLPWRAWWARTGGPDPAMYLAVFNLQDRADGWDLPWTDFHLAAKPHAVYDVWSRRDIPSANALRVEIPAHGCALYRVQ